MRRHCLTLIVLLAGLSGMLFHVSAGDEKVKKDTGLVVMAKLTEIPGTGEFPKYPKGSVYYNHVCVLRYEVIKVLKGKYKDKIIMVGHYMPRFPRSGIKDKMDKYVDGNLKQFKPGDIHKMVLDKPISKYWDREDAIFDDYFDDEEGERYFALRTDLVKKTEK